MSQRHADLLGGVLFAWRRATGERETRWSKRGVSLVSGMVASCVRIIASSALEPCGSASAGST